jgi:threonine dehydrogenase-like Zn-dependent dehydrogenase
MKTSFSDQGSVQTLVFVERNKLEWRERATPRIESANDAIVRPVAATTCDVDQMIIRGLTPHEGPFSIGHEAVGRVIEVGSGVKHVVPGDFVSIPWHISCGVCARCQNEQYAYCEAFPHGAMFGWNVGGDYGGLFDDVVHVPFANHMLVKLPDGVDPRHAASVSDNIAVAWEVLHDELKAKPEARILIMGGSASICLYCVDMARALGAKDVTYCDYSSKRLELARGYGAQVYKGAPKLDGPRYDIVIDASGKKDWLHAGLQMLTPHGLCDSVGIYFDDVPFPIFEMYMRDVRFRIGRGNARRAIPHVLDLMARKCICPQHVTTETHEWHTAPECLAHSAKPLLVRELGDE